MSDNLERLLTILRAEADLIDRLNKNSDFRYRSIQRLILENGQPFLEQVLPSPFRGVQGQCFQNCFEAMQEHQSLHYCEGFATDDNLSLAISHAWLVDDHGLVIDPTWDDCISGCTYFGVVFEKEYVIEMATKTGHYGVFGSDFMSVRSLQREGFGDSEILVLHNRTLSG